MGSSQWNGSDLRRLVVGPSAIEARVVLYRGNQPLIHSALWMNNPRAGEAGRDLDCIGSLNLLRDRRNGWNPPRTKLKSIAVASAISAHERIQQQACIPRTIQGKTTSPSTLRMMRTCAAVTWMLRIRTRGLAPMSDACLGLGL